MVFSYYPGCTLKTKGKDLDISARACAEALGFTLEELPFTLAFSNEELMEHILAFDEDVYSRKCRQYQDSIQYFDNGHAAEAVADIMENRRSDL